MRVTRRRSDGQGLRAVLVAGAAAVTVAAAAATAGTAGATVSGLHPSVTSVVCGPPIVPVGQAETCSVTVTAGTHPTGTVQFQTSSFGFPGACTLHLIGGNQARCSSGIVAGQVADPDTVTASYSGDALNTPSAGTTTIKATRALSTTTVSCSPSTVAVGAPTTCTATVGAFEPSGSVSFTMNQSGTFSAPSCTFMMIGSGQVSCSVTYTPRAIQSGAHKIYAKYSGDTGTLPGYTTTIIDVV